MQSYNIIIQPSIQTQYVLLNDGYLNLYNSIQILFYSDLKYENV